jgi:hypothetical protein
MGSKASSGAVTVALGALRSDATAWSSAGSSLTSASSAAKGAILTAADLSYFADKAGLTVTYAALQERVANLLGQAQTNFNNISTTLTQTATNYQSTESKNAHHFNNIHR